MQNLMTDILSTFQVLLQKQGSKGSIPIKVTSTVTLCTVQELSHHPSKQTNFRELPQSSSELLVMLDAAKSFSFPWTRDVRFIDSTLQAFNAKEARSYSMQCVKTLVMPRTSAHFPAHPFSSKSLSMEITPRRLRAQERGTQAHRLLFAQQRALLPESNGMHHNLTLMRWNSPNGNLVRTGAGPAEIQITP